MLRSFLNFLGGWIGGSALFLGMMLITWERASWQKVWVIAVLMGLLMGGAAWATLRKAPAKPNVGWRRWRPVAWVVGLEVVLGGVLSLYENQFRAEMLVALLLPVVFITFLGWVILSGNADRERTLATMSKRRALAAVFYGACAKFMQSETGFSHPAIARLMAPSALALYTMKDTDWWSPRHRDVADGQLGSQRMMLDAAPFFGIELDPRYALFEQGAAILNKTEIDVEELERLRLELLAAVAERREGAAQAQPA